MRQTAVPSGQGFCIHGVSGVMVSKACDNFKCAHILRDMLKEADWIAKVDLKNTYTTLPIQEYFSFSTKITCTS